MSQGNKKFGRIAFITTPKYRESHPRGVTDFVLQYLYPLCQSFEVCSTGRTHTEIQGILDGTFDVPARAMIAECLGFTRAQDHDVETWRQTIKAGLTSVASAVPGMIELAFDLVEGRLDAVIHLTDWADVSGKPDSMVLRREANVHNVPIASDLDSAVAAVRTWQALIIRGKGDSIFPDRKPPGYPLEGLTSDDKVLGLIAHDQMKLAMCHFVVEFRKEVFEHDYILATGTTGGWIRKFAIAAGISRDEVERKVRLCLSGPHGGDVQIAAAVVRKLCRKVIFLQDPFTSHPHETDIRLFEQAILLFERTAMLPDIDVELATNVASAKAILGV